MPQEPDFLPTAPLENLRLRAALLKAVRTFFDERGYLEVETPLVSADATVDPNLTPFVTHWIPAGASRPEGADFYLQTSPEFAMKRLLAAGAEAIYQVTHAFRNGELGTLHNPEFTLVEWYRTGDTYQQQMDVVEELVRFVWANDRMPLLAGKDGGRSLRIDGPFERLSYRDAFERYAGFDPLTIGTSDLAHMARKHGLTPPSGLAADDRDGWLNFLLIERVEPNLGQDNPAFLCDYPPSQAALASVRSEDPPVAQRFELYIRGIELCNGYQELTDADELRRRIRARSGSSADQRLLHSRLLDAMDCGLPDCAGVALGLDRLVMLAAGAASLAEVIAFPFTRA